MAEFPSIEWFEEFRSRANARCLPGRVGEAFSGAFALRVDEVSFSLQVFRGEIIHVESGLPGAGVLFTVCGPLEEWRRLLGGAVSFHEAANPLHGRLRAEGNLEALFADFGAVGNLMAALPEAQTPREPVQRDPYRAEEWCGDQIAGRYVLVDGVRTYYESIGNGTPIVCLHTAGSETRQWHGVMSRMGHRYRMVVFDMPGHGKSWPLPGERCIDTPGEYAAFMWRFVETLELARPVLMGCSLGGIVVLLLAQTRGDRLLGVISIQGADYMPIFSSANIQFMNHPHVSLPDMTDGHVASLIGRAACEEGRALIRWQTRQRVPDAYQADIRTATAFDLRAGIGSIVCPVLLVRGTDDWLISQSMVEETAARMGRAQLVTLPGTGHFTPAEAPTLLSAVAETFIDGLV